MSIIKKKESITFVVFFTHRGSRFFKGFAGSVLYWNLQSTHRLSLPELFFTKLRLTGVAV